MSIWRKMAIEIAPELKKNFQDPSFEIYSVFSALLDILIESLKKDDFEKVQKIYNYAEWCFHQNEQKLWNAAGVSFYEHLGDEMETLTSFTTWVKKDIYFGIRDLLQARMHLEQLMILDKFYDWKE